MINSRRSIVGAVVALAVGCSTATPTPTPSTGGELGGPFGPQTVERTVSMLAAAGVPVRVRPADSPLVAVDVQSRIGLLRFQVRNLALEANAGTGTTGDELDEYAAEAGSQPLSPLIAAWLQVADTPAVRQARVMMPTTDPIDPGQIVVPGAVAMLFLADLVGPSPAPAGDVSVPRGRAAVGGLVAAEDDFCSQVSAYLSSVLEDVLDPALSLNPPWLDTAARAITTIDTEPEEMHRAVGALALLAYATSISRPWVAKLTAVPSDVHYIIGEDELIPPSKEFSLIVNVGEGSIADEAGECADLAGADLTGEEEAGATPVIWVMPELQPHAVDVEGDLELEERGQFAAATLEYQTRKESREAHEKGTLRTMLATVTAIVQRADIESVEEAMRELIIGADLGAAGSLVAAEFERLKRPLRDRLYPRGSAKVQVSWHEGPQKTPEPTPDESPNDEPTDQPEPGRDRKVCASGCAMSNGDPHIVTIDNTSYDFMEAGEYVLLRDRSGGFELQARQEPWGDSATVSINTALAVRSGASRIGIYVTDAGTLDVTLDGGLLDLQSGPVSVGGTTITYLDDVMPLVAILLSDGTIVGAFGEFGLGVSVMVDPSDALRETAVGIMGPVQPTGMAVPALPDGSVLPAALDEAAYLASLYGAFADGWRVTDQTSLFDYEPGTTSATYNLPDFPGLQEVRRMQDLTPEQLAAGEAACAHLAPGFLRDQCVYDVGVTGETGYAAVYDFSANVVETGALLPTGQRVRVANLYSNDTGPTALDVYAWTDAGAALVAAVPFGEASDWFDPGSLIEYERPTTKLSLQRKGEPVNEWGLNLVDLRHDADLEAGVEKTIVIGTSSLDQFAWVGGRSATISELYEEAPLGFPLTEAPSDSALLFLELSGLVYTHPGVDFFISAGDGCLTQPGFEGLAQLSGVGGESTSFSVGYEGPLALEPGSGLELSLHAASVSDDPFTVRCDTPFIHGPIQLEIGPGERAHFMLYAAPADPTIRSLVLPFGD